MVIYKITNSQNGKFYIGQTINTAETRWQRHQQDALSGRLDTHFARAIREYGPDSFSLEIVDTASSQEELTRKESEWIKKLNAVEEGYNETSAEEKSGGFTYKSKTEEELKIIGEKIAKTKKGGNNINATSVKCRNVQTGEEYFFDSQAEMQKFFKAPNHIFISRRCRGEIKSLYLGIWEIAYADCEYGEARNEQTYRATCPKVRYVTVKKLETGEQKDFPSYAEAERYFGLKPRSFSSKASQKPSTYQYKGEYEITKHY